jgi:hypothetical protein
MGVPVLAYAATAVPATMDGAGVLYSTKTRCTGPRYQCGWSMTVSCGAHHRRASCRARSSRSQGLRGDADRPHDRVLASPRREHPPVAFDFWDQAERAEEFDEIKQYRPAAFQALPRDPSTGGGEPAAE